jgi:hypothetical protein
MKIFLEILTFTLHNTSENRIFNGLSGTFRLGSRMFLVCFSFILRSNLLPDGLEIGLEQVQSFRRQIGNRQIGNRQLARGNWQKSGGNWQEAIDRSQEAIGRSQEAIGRRQLAIGRRQLAIGKRHTPRRTLRTQLY